MAVFFEVICTQRTNDLKSDSNYEMSSSENLVHPDISRIPQNYTFHIDNRTHSPKVGEGLDECVRGIVEKHPKLKSWFLLSAADLYATQRQSIAVLEKCLYGYHAGVCDMSGSMQDVHMCLDDTADHVQMIFASRLPCLGLLKKEELKKFSYLPKNMTIMNIEQQVSLAPTYVVSSVVGCEEGDKVKRMNMSQERHFILTEDADLIEILQNMPGIQVQLAYEAKNQTCKDVMKNLSQFKEIMSAKANENVGIWKCLPLKGRPVVKFLIALSVLCITVLLMHFLPIWGGYESLFSSIFKGYSSQFIATGLGGLAFFALFTAAVLLYCGALAYVNLRHKIKVLDTSKGDGSANNNRFASELVGHGAKFSNEKKPSGSSPKCDQSGPNHFSRF